MSYMTTSKPPNVLVDDSGLLKLVDFGQSFVYRSCNFVMRRGTRWYSPPESLLGAPAYGPPADMWSTGCILAELALKCAPFHGHDHCIAE